MKEDELEELRELNKHLQTLLKEEDENANILRHNLNVNQYLLLITLVKNLCNHLNLSYILDLARKVENSKRQAQCRSGKFKCKSNTYFSKKKKICTNYFLYNCIHIFLTEFYIMHYLAFFFGVSGGSVEDGIR